MFIHYISPFIAKSHCKLKLSVLLKHTLTYDPTFINRFATKIATLRLGTILQLNND